MTWRFIRRKLDSVKRSVEQDFWGQKRKLWKKRRGQESEGERGVCWGMDGGTRGRREGVKHKFIKNHFRHQKIQFHQNHFHPCGHFHQTPFSSHQIESWDRTKHDWDGRNNAVHISVKASPATETRLMPTFRVSTGLEHRRKAGDLCNGNHSPHCVDGTSTGNSRWHPSHLPRLFGASLEGQEPSCLLRPTASNLLPKRRGEPCDVGPPTPGTSSFNRLAAVKTAPSSFAARG